MTEPSRRAAKILVGAALVFVAGLLATALRRPVLFAALGPTIVLLLHQPLLEANRPVAILLGHALGALVGLAALFLFGLTDAPSALEAGFGWARIGAATLAMAGVLVVEEDTPLYHPPAGATTLLVVLGIMKGPADLAGMAVGVAVLALAAALWRHHAEARHAPAGHTSRPSRGRRARSRASR
jgi:hypothetical protein